MGKALGILLVLAASLLTGKYEAARLQERVHHLRELINILALLRSRIHYSGNPLPQIFREISFQAASPWRDIFFRHGQGMERSDRTLAENWQSALRRMEAETALKKEDIALLQPLLSGIGDLDRERSAAAVDMISGQLQGQLQEATAKREERTRMAVTLSVTAGLFIVVLLL